MSLGSYLSALSATHLVTETGTPAELHVGDNVCITVLNQIYFRRAGQRINVYLAVPGASLDGLAPWRARPAKQADLRALMQHIAQLTDLGYVTVPADHLNTMFRLTEKVATAHPA